MGLELRLYLPEVFAEVFDGHNGSFLHNGGVWEFELGVVLPGVLLMLAGVDADQEFEEVGGVVLGNNE